MARCALSLKGKTALRLKVDSLPRLSCGNVNRAVASQVIAVPIGPVRAPKQKITSAKKSS